MPPPAAGRRTGRATATGRPWRGGRAVVAASVGRGGEWGWDGRDSGVGDDGYYRMDDLILTSARYTCSRASPSVLKRALYQQGHSIHVMYRPDIDYHSIRAFHTHAMYLPGKEYHSTDPYDTEQYRSVCLDHGPQECASPGRYIGETPSTGSTGTAFQRAALRFH